VLTVYLLLDIILKFKGKLRLELKKEIGPLEVCEWY